jgi:predicted metal-dependent HD superfamily phosphohydrolase
MMTTAKLDGIDLVSALILATKHDVIPSDKDQQILVDVDLAILGQPTAIFLEYENNIRKEYSWVLEKDFREGRAKVLKRFLDRSHIYSTSVFQAKYEDKARANLKASIQNL